MRYLLTFLMLLLISAIAAAQEATPEGWEVVQRCVGEPTTPPEGWNYEGTILLWGNYGIHAIQVDWDVPRVVAFIRDQTIFGGAGLSPDGNWYAVLVGEPIYTGSGPLSGYNVERIQVYSTSNPESVYTVSWVGQIAFSNREIEERQMRWYDNTHILFEAAAEGTQPTFPENFVLINPFSNGLESYSTSFNPVDPYRFQPSPDWSKVIYNPNTLFEESIWGLYNLSTEELISPLSLADHYTQIAWMPDSSMVAAEVGSITGGEIWLTENISVFDNTGELLEVVYSFKPEEYLPTRNLSSAPSMSWSSDGNFLAFTISFSGGTSSTVYIADMNRNVVFDLCYSTTDSIAWSPEGNRLVFTHYTEQGTATDQGDFRVDVLNLDSWEFHTVASGYSVIGWRAANDNPYAALNCTSSHSMMSSPSDESACNNAAPRADPGIGS